MYQTWISWYNLSWICWHDLSMGWGPACHSSYRLPCRCRRMSCDGGRWRSPPVFFVFAQAIFILLLPMGSSRSGRPTSDVAGHHSSVISLADDGDDESSAPARFRLQENCSFWKDNNNRMTWSGFGHPCSPLIWLAIAEESAQVCWAAYGITVACLLMGRSIVAWHTQSFCGSPHPSSTPVHVASFVITMVLGMYVMVWLHPKRSYQRSQQLSSRLPSIAEQEVYRRQLGSSLWFFGRVAIRQDRAREQLYFSGSARDEENRSFTTCSMNTVLLAWYSCQNRAHGGCEPDHWCTIAVFSVSGGGGTGWLRLWWCF
jgi:hypothetical protein